MRDINEIYQMLNWENPPGVQSEGLRQAREIHDLSLLIEPPAPPSVWEHCAAVLYEKSDAELAPYLDGLLTWLQDLNWPGALKIAERLKAFSGRQLTMSLESAVIKAAEMAHSEESMWLGNLSELLDNPIVSANLSDGALSLLQRHCHN